MGIGKVVDTNRAVFLDRDGVVNKAVVREGKPYPPATVSELELIDGIQRFVTDVKELGYKVFVITNQPDVARGKTAVADVHRIHDYLAAQLGIDKFYTCLHDDKDDCDCRKPKPGMIFQAKVEWNVDLNESFLIGDRWRDIAAGKAANVRSILIDYDYDEPKGEPDYVVSNLNEAFRIIDKHHNP